MRCRTVLMELCMILVGENLTTTRKTRNTGKMAALMLRLGCFGERMALILQGRKRQFYLMKSLFSHWMSQIIRDVIICWLRLLVNSIRDGTRRSHMTSVFGGQSVWQNGYSGIILSR